MVHDFQPGDFLIFQLEAGYGLLRVLDAERIGDEEVWHLAAYRDLFLDPGMADVAIDDPQNLEIEIPHAALTNRAFESTQVAKMGNAPLTEQDLRSYKAWQASGQKEITDRSIRLLLGWR